MYRDKAESSQLDWFLLTESKSTIFCGALSSLLDNIQKAYPVNILGWYHHQLIHSSVTFHTVTFFSFPLEKFASKSVHVVHIFKISATHILCFRQTTAQPSSQSPLSPCGMSCHVTQPQSCCFIPSFEQKLPESFNDYFLLLPGKYPYLHFYVMSLYCFGRHTADVLMCQSWLH